MQSIKVYRNGTENAFGWVESGITWKICTCLKRGEGSQETGYYPGIHVRGSDMASDGVSLKGSGSCFGAIQPNMQNTGLSGDASQGAEPNNQCQDSERGITAQELRDLVYPTSDDQVVVMRAGCTIRPTHDVRQVYCAGPLFNPAERETMEQIAEALERAGFKTFVPHRDGLEFAKVAPHLESLGVSAEQASQCLLDAIDALDCYQVLVRCGSLVFNAAGRVPDEGAVAEAAMAYVAGKPVVYFKYGDPRTKIAGVDNPLVRSRGGPETVHTIRDIPAALEQRIGELSPSPHYSFECSGHVARKLEAGRAIWEMLVERKAVLTDDNDNARQIAGDLMKILNWPAHL